MPYSRPKRPNRQPFDPSGANHLKFSGAVAAVADTFLWAPHPDTRDGHRADEGGAMRTASTLLATGLIAACCGDFVRGQSVASRPERTVREPAWHSNFEQALAEAQRLGRPLLVHFYSEWCGPCRRMDRDILRQADVAAKLGRRFVAVKVDADIHPELVERFDVRALPTDVIITADGQVLDAAEGFRERPAFLAGLDRAIIRFDLAVAGSTSVGTQPVSIEFSDEPVTSMPAEPSVRGNASQPPAAGTDRSVTGRSPRTIVGLDGYSPVSLWQWREWRKGRRDFAVEHQGVTYFLATVHEAEEFREAPERFVPQLLGCDPVVLFETDRALPGSTRYGAYYDGQLYLFVGKETRSRFKESPTRYTQTKHVLHADDLSDTVLK
jgi:thiol-disulfide isomerase/thioredoxin/YHS domain-containing protein